MIRKIYTGTLTATSALVHGAAVGIGEAIRRARVERRLSQGALAKALRVSQPTVSSWERGENEPNLEMINRVEAELGMPLGELLRIAGHGGGAGTSAEAIAEMDARMAALREMLRAEPEVTVAADGVDLSELRRVDPAAYDKLMDDARWLLARARERRSDG